MSLINDKQFTLLMGNLIRRKVDEDEAYAAVVAHIDAQMELDRKDAERYRWLREGAYEGYPSSEGSSNKDAYLVITGYDSLYPMSDIQKDAAIDAELAKNKKEIDAG